MSVCACGGEHARSTRGGRARVCQTCGQCELPCIEWSLHQARYECGLCRAAEQPQEEAVRAQELVSAGQMALEW